MNNKLVAEIAGIIMKYFPDMDSQDKYKDCAVVILDLIKNKEIEFITIEDGLSYDKSEIKIFIDTEKSIKEIKEILKRMEGILSEK